MKTTLSILVLCFCLTATAQSTTFILVRHAEKVMDGSKDPNLTSDGLERANQLAQLLEKAEIDAIYSTDFTRTRLTVKPLAETRNLEIKTYNFSKPKRVLSGWLADHPKQTIVISGHSNTTPYLANLLLGEQLFEQFDDSDYGNILVITATELGNGRLLHLRF